MAELRAYPVATFERNSGVGRSLQRLVAQGAPPLHPTMVTNSLHALRMLAESGAGVALVCPHSVQNELTQRRLIAVPVHANGPVPIALNICVLQGRRRSFALGRFIGELIKPDTVQPSGRTALR
jgi:DNA-binding transcriptional LysR family regulator